MFRTPIFSAAALALTLSMPVHAQSATKDECVLKCHEAAALVQSKGVEAAAQELANPKGSFVWKDSYVFLMNLEGRMLAHPMQPELMQLPHCLLITDPTDKAIFVSFVNLARKQDQGWVNYIWPKPGKKSPSKKTTFVYRIPGKDLFVAAGVYVDGMMY